MIMRNEENKPNKIFGEESKSVLIDEEERPNKDTIIAIMVANEDNIPQYENLVADDICTKEPIELSVDSARQEIVLLQNNNTLLLAAKKNDKKIKIAFIDHHAKATDVMRVNYVDPLCRYASPFDAFSKDV